MDVGARVLLTLVVTMVPVQFAEGQARTGLPLVFVENHGQWPEGVRYAARGGGIEATFQEHAICLRVRGEDGAGSTASSTVRLEIEGAGVETRIEGDGRLRGNLSIIRGRDPTGWRCGIPLYRALVYRCIGEGLDLRVREGTDGVIEYDVEVAPHANPGFAVFHCRGAVGLDLDDDGALIIETEVGCVRQPRPRAWEVTEAGERRMVPSRFRLLGERRFGFEIERDPSLAAVIDPQLTWATAFGGRGTDEILAVALESDGSILLGGSTDSPDFLVGVAEEAGSRRITGPQDAFVVRLNAEGNEILSWVLLGGSGLEGVSALAVNADGAVLVAGYTTSTDFPVTPGAFQDHHGSTSLVDRDGFIVKLTLGSDASVSYSTYLGGAAEDACSALILDPDGAVVVSGATASFDFPTTPGAYQTSYGGGESDVFVARVNPDPDLDPSEQLAYSTFLGGQGADASRSSPWWRLFMGRTAYDDGDVVVVGSTRSDDFPTTPDAFQSTRAGSSDGFVVRLRPSSDDPPQEQIVYATYFGGSSWDRVTDVALDPDGRILFVGSTASWDFPRTPGAIPVPQFETVDEAFLVCLDPDLGQESLVYATWLGGYTEDYGMAVAAGLDGDAFVAGWTFSPDFPVTADAAYTQHKGEGDVFLCRIRPDPTLPLEEQLLYSTFVGGTGYHECFTIAADEMGKVVVAGGALATDFPTTPGTLPSKQEYVSAIVARFDFGQPLPLPIAAFVVQPEYPEVGEDVSFDAGPSTTVEGTDILSYEWDFGDGSSGVGKIATHIYEEPGHYAVTLTVRNSAGLSGKARQTVKVHCATRSLFGWQEADLDDPPLRGSAWAADDGDGVVEICASGRGVGGKRDQLHFVYREISGDFAVTLGISDRPLGQYQVAVCARESLDPEARAVAVAVDATTLSDRDVMFTRIQPETTAQRKTRETSGGWVRLERRGQVFIGLWSDTGEPGSFKESHRVDFSQLTPSTEFPSSILVGMSAANKDDGLLALPPIQLELMPTLELLPSSVGFVRGDANQDLQVDLSDAIVILNYLFLGGSIACLDAADVDDDGEIVITDPIALLNFLFLGGPSPAAPYPNTGSDPTDGDLLDCVRLGA